MKNAFATPESVVLRSCLDYLAIRGIFAYRQNTGAAVTESGSFVRFGLQGGSDIVGILPGGRFLAIECKRSRGGRITQEQANYLAEINRHGGLAMVVRSVDDLILGLREAGF